MAHYDFYAEKKVTSIGARINGLATVKLARMFSAGLHLSAKDKPSVLEIGPGQGLFASRLKDLMAVAYKAYEPERLLYEKMLSQGFSVVNSTVPPIPDHNDQFDAVALINVLEHMPGTTAAEELLKEIGRVLKKTGMLFIVVPNYLDWGKDFFNLDYTHQLITTEYRLTQMLSDAGFCIQSMRYHYGCFFSGIGRIPNALTRLCRSIFTLLLPRRFSRKETVQKLAVLFAENIICTAGKKDAAPAARP